MSKDKNVNSHNNSDAFPGRVDWGKVREKMIDPDLGALQNHERIISELDKSHPQEKGGSG